MASAPPNKIERAHQMYRDGSYEQALGFYTEALAMAKTKPQQIALHSNRAACYLKLHYFKKAAEECTSVLELDNNHTGALMLRAQTLVTLTEYSSALFDVNRLMELNPSSEVYHNLQARLKTQLLLAPIPEADAEEEAETDSEEDIDVVTHTDDDIDVGAHTDEDEEQNIENHTVPSRTNDDSLVSRIETGAEVTASKTHSIQKSSEQGKEEKAELKKAAVTETKTLKESSEQHSQGWQAIPKPKGHSTLDYARWSKVADDSSDEDDDDDDDEDSQPQYRFRVKTVGVRQVK